MVVVYWPLLFCQFICGLRPRMALPSRSNSWRISWRFVNILAPGNRRASDFSGEKRAISGMQKVYKKVHAHESNTDDSNADHWRMSLLNSSLWFSTNSTDVTY